MSKSDRRIIIGLGGLIVLLVIGALWHVSSYNQNQREHREKAASYEIHSDDRNSRCAKHVTVFERIACLVENVTADQEQERGRADLHAQQDMATWSVALLWASGIGIVVSAGGIVLIYATLIETRNMTLATRQIGENQTRAWMLYGGIGSGPAKNITFENRKIENGIGVKIDLKNFGASPAKIVMSEFDYEIVPYSADLPTLVGRKPPDAKIIVIPPGGTAHSPYIFLDEQESERFLSHELAIAVRMSIQYYTVFEEVGRSQPHTVELSGYIRAGSTGGSGIAYFERHGQNNRDD